MKNPKIQISKAWYPTIAEKQLNQTRVTLFNPHSYPIARTINILVLSRSNRIYDRIFD